MFWASNFMSYFRIAARSKYDWFVLWLQNMRLLAHGSHVPMPGKIVQAVFFDHPQVWHLHFVVYSQRWTWEIIFLILLQPIDQRWIQSIKWRRSYGTWQLRSAKVLWQYCKNTNRIEFTDEPMCNTIPWRGHDRMPIFHLRLQFSCNRSKPIDYSQWREYSSSYECKFAVKKKKPCNS